MIRQVCNSVALVNFVFTSLSVLIEIEIKFVTVHDPILSEVTFGARRFKTASKDGLGFKGRRRGHWA